MSAVQTTIITNEGRRVLASMNENGTPAYQIVKFAVGTGGYLPTDLTQSTVPDPRLTSLENEIFRGPYNSVEKLNEFAPVYVCRLGANQAIGLLGEAGLIGVYLSGVNVGQEFLFSVTHFGVKNKTNQDAFNLRFVVPF